MDSHRPPNIAPPKLDIPPLLRTLLPDTSTTSLSSIWDFWLLRDPRPENWSANAAQPATRKAMMVIDTRKRDISFPFGAHEWGEGKRRRPVYSHDGNRC